MKKVKLLLCFVLALILSFGTLGVMIGCKPEDETFRVVYQTNAANVTAPPSVDVKVNDSIELPTLTRAQYTFLGWKIGDSTDSEYLKGSLPYTVHKTPQGGTLVLRAFWEKVEVEIEEYEVSWTISPQPIIGDFEITSATVLGDPIANGDKIYEGRDVLFMWTLDPDHRVEIKANTAEPIVRRANETWTLTNINQDTTIEFRVIPPGDIFHSVSWTPTTKGDFSITSVKAGDKDITSGDTIEGGIDVSIDYTLSPDFFVRVLVNNVPLGDIQKGSGSFTIAKVLTDINISFEVTQFRFEINSKVLGKPDDTDFEPEITINDLPITSASRIEEDDVVRIQWFFIDGYAIYVDIDGQRITPTIESAAEPPYAWYEVVAKAQDLEIEFTFADITTLSIIVDKPEEIDQYNPTVRYLDQEEPLVSGESRVVQGDVLRIEWPFIKDNTELRLNLYIITLLVNGEIVEQDNNNNTHAWVDYTVGELTDGLTIEFSFLRVYSTTTNVNSQPSGIELDYSVQCQGEDVIPNQTLLEEGSIIQLVWTLIENHLIALTVNGEAISEEDITIEESTATYDIIVGKENISIDLNVVRTNEVTVSVVLLEDDAEVEVPAGVDLVYSFRAVNSGTPNAQSPVFYAETDRIMHNGALRIEWSPNSLLDKNSPDGYLVELFVDGIARIPDSASTMTNTWFNFIGVTSNVNVKFVLTHATFCNVEVQMEQPEGVSLNYIIRTPHSTAATSNNPVFSWTTDRLTSGSSIRIEWSAQQYTSHEVSLYISDDEGEWVLVTPSGTGNNPRYYNILDITQDVLIKFVVDGPAMINDRAASITIEQPQGSELLYGIRQHENPTTTPIDTSPLVDLSRLGLPKDDPNKFILQTGHQIRIEWVPLSTPNHFVEIWVNGTQRYVDAGSIPQLSFFVYTVGAADEAVNIKFIVLPAQKVNLTIVHPEENSSSNFNFAIRQQTNLTSNPNNTSPEITGANLEHLLMLPGHTIRFTWTNNTISAPGTQTSHSITLAVNGEVLHGAKGLNNTSVQGYNYTATQGNDVIEVLVIIQSMPSPTGSPVEIIIVDHLGNPWAGPDIQGLKFSQHLTNPTSIPSSPSVSNPNPNNLDIPIERFANDAPDRFTMQVQDYLLVTWDSRQPQIPGRFISCNAYGYQSIYSSTVATEFALSFTRVRSGGHPIIIELVVSDVGMDINVSFERNAPGSEDLVLDYWYRQSNVPTGTPSTSFSGGYEYRGEDRDNFKLHSGHRLGIEWDLDSVPGFYIMVSINGVSPGNPSFGSGESAKLSRVAYNFTTAIADEFGEVNIVFTFIKEDAVRLTIVSEHGADLDEFDFNILQNDTPTSSASNSSSAVTSEVLSGNFIMLPSHRIRIHWYVNRSGLAVARYKTKNGERLATTASANGFENESMGNLGSIPYGYQLVVEINGEIQKPSVDISGDGPNKIRHPHINEGLVAHMRVDHISDGRPVEIVLRLMPMMEISVETYIKPENENDDLIKTDNVDFRIWNRAPYGLSGSSSHNNNLSYGYMAIGNDNPQEDMDLVLDPEKPWNHFTLMAGCKLALHWNIHNINGTVDVYINDILRSPNSTTSAVAFSNWLELEAVTEIQGIGVDIKFVITPAPPLEEPQVILQVNNEGTWRFSPVIRHHASSVPGSATTTMLNPIIDQPLNPNGTLRLEWPLNIETGYLIQLRVNGKLQNISNAGTINSTSWYKCTYYNVRIPDFTNLNPPEGQPFEPLVIRFDIILAGTIPVSETIEGLPQGQTWQPRYALAEQDLTPGVDMIALGQALVIVWDKLPGYEIKLYINDVLCTPRENSKQQWYTYEVNTDDPVNIKFVIAPTGD